MVIVHKLMAEASRRFISIWSVLHVNYGTTKMRGHLGTEIAHKVSDVLSCQKDKSQDPPLFTVEQVKAFLYGTEYPKALVEVGITRKLTIETDAVDLLSALFNVVTSAQIYSAIILWIDEFEDIALQNSNGINAANSFIKIMLDKTPNRLLMFINFTLSAIASVESLGDYLQEAVKSRIVERIELRYPKTADVMNYISELLNNPIFRTEEVENPYTPFSADVVCKIVTDLGSVSLRKYNESFSRLLDIAAFENQEAIDMGYYEAHKTEIVTNW